MIDGERDGQRQRVKKKGKRIHTKKKIKTPDAVTHVILTTLLQRAITQTFDSI